MIIMLPYFLHYPTAMGLCESNDPALLRHELLDLQDSLAH